MRSRQQGQPAGGHGCEPQLHLPLVSGEGLHDPGGRALPLPKDVTATAVFSGPNDCYRLRLEWVWQLQAPTAMMLGMNPSRAGLRCGDRTVEKFNKLSRMWGCGRNLIGNAHGYRAMNQMRLAEVEDPIGPGNDDHVLAMAAEADIIVIGCGKPRIKALQETGPALCRKLVAAGYGPKLRALYVGQDGWPWHILYLSEKLQPKPWLPR